MISRLRVASNAGVGSTYVLIYQALHDLYGFGRKRFAAINDVLDIYGMHINHSERTYREYRERIEAAGMDYQMQQDFIRWLKKGLQVSGKAENYGAEIAMEYTYTLMLHVLYEMYGFKRQRLRRLQKKLKSYAQSLRDGDVIIVEFMKCLECECGQKFIELKRWEEQYGEVKIYG